MKGYQTCPLCLRHKESYDLRPTYLCFFVFLFFFSIFRFQSPSLYHEFTFTYFSCLLSFILFTIISNAHLLLMNKILLRSAAKIGGEIAYCEAMTTGKNKFPQCFHDVGRSKKHVTSTRYVPQCLGGRV